LYYTVITSMLFQIKLIKLNKCHMSLKMASTFRFRELSYRQWIKSINMQLTSL